MGHIKFLFDKTGSYLTITGDYGEAVFCWASSKNTLENIKADMKLKGLKGKEYIHSIGKWNEYIDYLKKNMAIQRKHMMN